MLFPAEYRLRIVLKRPYSIQHVRELEKMEGVGVGGGLSLSEILVHFHWTVSEENAVACAEVKQQDDTGSPCYSKIRFTLFQAGA